MNAHAIRFLSFGLAASVAAIVACSGQPPAIVGSPSDLSASKIHPYPAPAPTGTVIAYGDAIGAPTFAAGDTNFGGRGQPVDGIGCDAVMDTSYHIHIHLDIYDKNGHQLQLPWGIGIVPPHGFDSLHNAVQTGKCYYDLHTHDLDGVIHYETADHKNLTLGTFFDIWGMPLSQTNVANYQGTIWVMYGTGVPSKMTWSNAIDPRTIPLVEHEFIYLAVDNPPEPSSLPVYHWSY
jgi:hypothetical protein